MIGRTLTLQGGVSIEVADVIDLPPAPSHLNDETLQVLVPVTFLRQLYTAVHGVERAQRLFGGWQAFEFRTYVRLPDASPGYVANLNDQLKLFAERHVPSSTNTKRRFRAEHVSSLSMARLSNAEGAMSNVSIAVLLAAIVLIIASFNHSALVAAQSYARRSEMAIRRSIGAGTMQIALQIVVETALVVLISLALSCGLVVLLASVLQGTIAMTISMSAFGLPFWLGSFAAALVTIVIAACYPAMTLCRKPPIAALRDAEVAGTRGFLAPSLVVLQFAAVSFLIIGVLVVRAQNILLRTVGESDDADPVVVIFNDLQAADVSPPALSGELERVPLVKAVTYSSFIRWSGRTQ